MDKKKSKCAIPAVIYVTSCEKQRQGRQLSYWSHKLAELNWYLVRVMYDLSLFVCDWIITICHCSVIAHMVYVTMCVCQSAVRSTVAYPKIYLVDQHYIWRQNSSCLDHETCQFCWSSDLSSNTNGIADQYCYYWTQFFFLHCQKNIVQHSCWLEDKMITSWPSL